MLYHAQICQHHSYPAHVVHLFCRSSVLIVSIPCVHNCLAAAEEKERESEKGDSHRAPGAKCRMQARLTRLPVTSVWFAAARARPPVRERLPLSSSLGARPAQRHKPGVRPFKCRRRQRTGIDAADRAHRPEEPRHVNTDSAVNVGGRKCVRPRSLPTRQEHGETGHTTKLPAQLEENHSDSAEGGLRLSRAMKQRLDAANLSGWHGRTGSRGCANPPTRPAAMRSR